MDLIAGIVNAVVISTVGVILWLLIKGRLESLEHRIQSLEGSVNARIDSLRSDLTQVALAVGAKPRSEPG